MAPACAWLARVEMHRLRVKRDLLMVLASLSVLPSAPVRLTASLPARSTRHSLLVRALPVTVSLASTWMVMMLWLREEDSFMPVAPTDLWASPTRTSSSSSSLLPTYSSITPSTYTPCSALWRMVRLMLPGLSRSRTRSR